MTFYKEMRTRIVVTFFAVVAVTLTGMVIESFETATWLVTVAWWGTMPFLLLLVWIAQQAESRSSEAASVISAMIPVVGLIAALTWCETDDRAVEDSAFATACPLLAIASVCGAFIGVAVLNERGT